MLHSAPSWSRSTKRLDGTRFSGGFSWKWAKSESPKWEAISWAITHHQNFSQISTFPKLDEISPPTPVRIFIAKYKKLAQFEWWSSPKHHSNTDASMLFHARQLHQWVWYPMSYPLNFHILCFIQLHLEVEAQKDWMGLVSVADSLENERNLKAQSEKPFHEL